MTLRFRLAVVLQVIFAGCAVSQTGQVTGRITDATGAVIPGASVVVTNVGTAVDRKVASNTDGYYTVPLLQPGEYRVTVEHPGFKPVVRSGIVLAVDQRAELNFALEVGLVTERIEVEAATPRLNTVEASQGQVIENKRIVELPLNGRNYNDLALLSAGAVQPLGNARLQGFSSGGMRDSQNNFILDGIDNNPAELAGAQRRSEMVQPSIDGIQEFKVQTNAYAAEYGRAMGAVVNVTTRSGTNELHGSLFEFLRNEKLDARNFFAPPGARPPFKRNQYGFAVGGPVYLPKLVDGRNRLFFFTDYEGTKIRESTTSTSTIPTMAMRSGDFRELAAQRNVAIMDPDAVPRAPFPNNSIPLSRLDPVALELVKLYPTPKSSGVVANFVYNAPRPQDLKKFDVRTDINAGSKDNVFWRLSRQDSSTPAVSNLPPPAYSGGPFDSKVTGINTGATWNHIFTPNLIMSVRGGWNYGWFWRDAPASARSEFWNQKLGIKGGTNTIPGSFSNFNPTGYAALGIGPNNPVDRDSQNRQLAGDATWTRGTHTVKFGGSILRSQNNIFNMRNEIGGPYQFNARYTGDGMADFLLGMASQFTWNTRIQVNLRSWNEGLFIQDDWKVTRNLTLNLGLRYEIVLPFTEMRDKMGVFDAQTNPAQPRLVVAGVDGKDRYNRAMIGTDKNNFMPRVGFAYKLGQKTVIRSGYGVFYGYMEPLGDAEWLIGNPPIAYGVTLTSSATVPALRLRQGVPAGALDIERATGLTVSAIERKAISPYAQQWNFNVQLDLGHEWMTEVGYSGSKGTHIQHVYDDNYSPPGPGVINSKRPLRNITIPGTSFTPELGPIYGYHFNGNSNYHALVTRLEKRFSSGFTFLTSYTFSKAIGDICGAASSGNAANCGYQDVRNLRAERSVDNIDIPHRFVASGVYELPVGRGRHFGSGMPAIANAFVGGWSMGSIVTMASGPPMSVVLQGNVANSGSLNIVDRPDVIGDPYDITRTLEQDFNTAAFAPHAAYVIGNAGRNILRQRGFFNWDFSAHKEFPLHERMRLQFRFEAFQFTNTPKFGAPGTVLGAGAFGRITSADTPRVLQFGMKLLW